MEFTINTKMFIKYVTPAADIALKNANKYHCCFGMIKITAYPKVLMIEAYGGTASITVKVRQSDGYKHGRTGEVCILAKELIDTLKSLESFDDLLVCVKDGKLKLLPESDIYNYNKIQIQTNSVVLPESSEEYDHELTVDREHFIKGLKQIQYAPASDERLFSYMCIVFESAGNSLKFTAGSGARFTAVEYIGNNKMLSSKDIKMIFPKTNISNVLRIFEKNTSLMLKIKESDGDITNNIHAQQVIESDNIIVRIYGAEYFTQYPNLSNIMSHNYTYQIPTKVQDWKYVAAAITASRHSLSEPLHNIKVMIDLQHGNLDVQVNSLMSINRRVQFELETCIADISNKKSYKPWFCCDANHIVEMVKKNKTQNTVIFNFEDQAKLDPIDADNPQKRKPVLLKFPNQLHKDGVTEKSFVLFSISLKWDDKYLSIDHDGVVSRFEILDL